MKLLYEGKAKKIFETKSSNEVLVSFKNDATAFNGLKKDSFEGKGQANLAISLYFFRLLEEHGINTHLVSHVDATSFVAEHLTIIPLEVVVRNYSAGSICKRQNMEKGLKFEPPMCEFFLKDDSKGDPIMTEDEILENKMINQEEIDYLKDQALKINSILFDYLDKQNITLVDFKIEFGKNSNNEIVLADEISPDTCRFWVKGTMDSLDKDVYREDKGNLVESYLKFAEIIGVKL